MNANIRTLNLMLENNLECTILTKHSSLPKNAVHLFYDYELNNNSEIIKNVSIYKTFKNGKVYAILTN